jgi:NADP-dependent aldehyde dehydrogenase
VATVGAQSFDPRTGAAVVAPEASSAADVDDAASRAHAAAPLLAGVPPATRAGWLDAIADALDAESDALAALADEETALGLPRLTGELANAAKALRFYGSVARDGSYLGATLDSAGPGRADIRRVNVPLGPVAVFGASNFPFGFGVLGHDTATALAAGCPVVIKAHPAHPRLSARLAELATAALSDAGAPAGALALVAGFAAGGQLVAHPLVRAVGFTGSQSGGLALWRLASQRPEVIPVYAEMGTVNSAVVTAQAAEQRAADIAAGFVGSFTLGMGQFCTKPGLLLVPARAQLIREVGRALTAAAPQGWMLTEAIAGAYDRGLRRLVEAGARVIAQTDRVDAGWAASPTVLQVDISNLVAGSPLLEECFGPVALVAEYEPGEQLVQALDALPSSLATAVHAAGPDDPELPELITRLSRRCGRVVVDGWPTGVALGWAQHHGGPWPATSAPAVTSVGAAALNRFVRPVAYQGVSGAALPPAVRDDNPWRIPRRVDGIMQQ